MFFIDENKSIHVTRGDAIRFTLTAKERGEEHSEYEFGTGEIVRFKVFEKKDCACVVLQKDFEIEANASTVVISLDKNDTKIGETISKPTEYWYEVELNPEVQPQTIIGYDEDGAKQFILYPEGGDAK
jgi:hypothetical protein